jgi:hypothetical protein
VSAGLECTRVQVYASYKYPRAQVQRLRPGRAVEQAGEFTRSTLTSSSGDTRRVGPFHMKPDTALRYMPTCAFST